MKEVKTKEIFIKEKNNKVDFFFEGDIQGLLRDKTFKTVY